MRTGENLSYTLLYFLQIILVGGKVPVEICYGSEGHTLLQLGAQKAISKISCRPVTAQKIKVDSLYPFETLLFCLCIPVDPDRVLAGIRHVEQRFHLPTRSRQPVLYPDQPIYRHHPSLHSRIRCHPKQHPSSLQDLG